MESEEKELFDKMIRHAMRSFTQDSTDESRDYHQSMYINTKRELWKLQEKKNDQRD